MAASFEWCVTVWRKDRTESVHNRSVWRYYLGDYRTLFRHEISAAVHMPGHGGDFVHAPYCLKFISVKVSWIFGSDQDGDGMCLV